MSTQASSLQTGESRDSEAGAGDRDFVASLEKGLAVIQAFDATRPRLTLTDVSKLTGITRAAARRYLRTLTRLGYAEFDGRYFSLSPRILRLGYAYLSSASVPARLQPFLEKISQDTGESSSAAMFDGDEIVYIARSATRRIMSVGLGVGSRLPIYCTSLGRAILAHRPDSEIDAYLNRARLQPRTRFTATDKDQLRQTLLKVREQGYATINEELEIGLRSIAVPVWQQNGVVTIAINIGTQAARFRPAEMVERFLPVLKAAGQSVHYAL